MEILAMNYPSSSWRGERDIREKIRCSCPLPTVDSQSAHR